MLIYSFETLRSIAYASNTNTQLIRDKRQKCEPLHRHDYYEMIYVYDGEVIHVINGISYKLTTGSLVLLTPGDSHSIVGHSEYSTINICFVERKTLNNIPNSKLKTPVALLEQQDRIEIESLLYLAELEMNLKDNFSESITDRFIDWVLLIFQRNTTTTLCFDPLYNKLLLEVSDNFCTITLEDAAKIVGVSVSHFCRIFKRDFSMTFHSYLNLIRIRQAKSMLLNSDDSIAAIAEKVGYYNNPCRFYSNFKNIIGITPADFRKKYKKKAKTSKSPTLRSFIPEPNNIYPSSLDEKETKRL